MRDYNPATDDYNPATDDYPQRLGIHQRCQLCGNEHTRFGKLTDPNGHNWHICAECITWLWEHRQQLNQEVSQQETISKSIEVVTELLRQVLTERTEQ